MTDDNLQLLDVTVLLVEDDTPSRIYCSKILKKLVREVLVAENGLEGLNIFRERKCDIVVSDIGMPVMDGLEMSREIKKINKNIQIILTTALDNKNYLMQAIEIGINSYIVKPIQKDNLYEAVENAAKGTILEKEVHLQYDRIRKLSQAVEQSPSIAIIADEQGIIEYVNGSFVESTGLAAGNVIGSSPVNLFEDSEFRLKYIDFYSRASAKNSESKNENISLKTEFQNKKNNGDLVWLSATISTIIDENGDLKNILLLFEDITERVIAREAIKAAHDELELRVIERTEELRDANKKLVEEIDIRKETEKQLISAKEEAELANKAKSAFLAKVSHELRTPLNGIIGISSILLTDNLSEKQRKFLDMVKTSADSLLDIINDILDYSKIEAGKLQIVESTFELRKILEQAFDLHRHTALTKNLELEFDYDSNIPEYFLGDPGRLRQVVLNLTSNALKFTERGKIKLSVKLESTIDNKANLLFGVSDTGIGIPENKLEVLFRSFSQVDDSFTRKYGGTGLGLSISKEIIEMMHGKIWVESQLGYGSVFFFKIPLQISDKESLYHSNSQYLKSKVSDNFVYKSKKIIDVLIAEDSPINQEVIKQNLLKFKWNLTFADNGKQALEFAQNSMFDLIFMDIQMPEMDGLEAVAKLRKYEESNNKARAFVVGLTAHAFEEQINEAKEAGMDECVTKPFQWDVIYSIINNRINVFETSPILESTSVNYSDLIHSEDEIDLNIDALLSTLNNNKTILLKIIDYFLENIMSEYDKIKSGVENIDYFLVRSIAHKMKSEVGNFNSFKTVEICRELENMGKDKTFTNIDHYVNQLHTNLTYICEQLEKYRTNLKTETGA
jgi:PAS domain S-box-containing protein